MSQANVEIAKRAIDACNRRNLDAYDDVFTQDFEWFPAFAGTVEGGGVLLGTEWLEHLPASKEARSTAAAANAPHLMAGSGSTTIDAHTALSATSRP